jgi:LuxR family maltose regulon positive regulatory protein
MPKVPTHALTWTDERGLYELRPADPHLSSVVPGEEEPWLAWLTTHASFSFQGQAGHLNVLKEQRQRGGGYWYAYHWHQNQACKRYLGRTAKLTLVRLEAVAQALNTEAVRAKAMQAEHLIAGADRARQGARRVSATPSLEIPLTSLAPPPLPASLVEREPLLLRLDTVLAHPLTLVSAAAGFGKTTLLSAWASRCKGRIAWLSLSELDNSSTRFWVGLITALRRGAHGSPDLGQTAVALLQSPQPPELSAILTALLNELTSRETQPAPIVLVLDDYQVISDPAIHEGLSFFLEHQPAHLHLILSSRVDPDLPLSRLRVRGQMIEIREADLRFGEIEASLYLGRMLSATLSTEEVQQLVLRTEGWIAGLQLAALAMQKREDRTAFLQAFTGRHRYLLDYVQEEILARY